MKTMKLFTIIMLAVLGLSLSLTVAAQEDEDELQPGLAQYTYARSTDLRAEPDGSSDAVGRISPGAVVTVIEITDEGWALVKLGDIEGWTRASVLTNISEDELLQPGLAMYLGPPATDIRAEADNGAERLERIEPGETVTVLEVRDDGWVQVEFGEVVGWLRSVQIVNVTPEQLVDPDDPLPPPTGPYQVGQVYLHWVDVSREEVYTEEEGDYRELIVSIWYPADVPEDAERAIYWESVSGPGFDAWKTFFGDSIYGQQLERFGELKTHAYRDVSLAESDTSYPVVMMSHGKPAWLEVITHQALELASHGYVVVGINHTFYAGVTVFPDGRVLEFVQAPEMETLETAALDVSFVLDELESRNADDPDWMFSGALDIDRIGMFGYSFGGEVSVMAASMDDRILAIVNEDGGLGAYRLPRPEQPFLYISAGAQLYPSDGVNMTAAVRDFTHGSFADAIADPGLQGEILPLRSAEIIRAYVLAFFDEYLKGIEQPLLDGPSDAFPEVDFRINNPG